MTNFRITVTSDVACPWCYVGRRQLQQAQQLWFQKHPDSGDTFSVTYAPYQLNPGWPRGPGSSIEKQQFYDEKFGPGRIDMIHESLSKVGHQLGINFKYGGRTGNTRDSHRLIHLAKQYGPEVELKTIDGLFAAYFEHERDITTHETLQDIATQASIPVQDFKAAIVESDQGGAQVDKAVAQARSDGVSGVPDFQMQDRYRLSGANDPATFVRVFEKIKALG
ncbi:DSBA-like thioredoxin domain-containing protein [Hirsutella rhossiliensis]|uniref:DSBA-like thioredoxin domain-containing protein n=1 Tax=Hirsutella rhossiliensis TaxID=111463 RepID=A0A9P8SJC3_9HYPO|nr:DSBA-like thioredoxin domain-containing protein [Hirsutella rhossiliensis]KAH0964741.1 DSBA-like thioredoxin domain-containing protein [Hirsutella rhossiliensis]